MSASTTLKHPKERLYNAFKYTIYFLIFLNIFYWLYEDYQASAHLYRDGISWQDIGDAFAQSVDTFAWFILLIALELETYTISDSRLHGTLKWSLNLVAGFCYFLIILSFIGYYDKFDMVFSFEPATYDTACAAVGHILSYAVELDDYMTLTAESCLNIGSPLYVNPEVSMISDAATLNHMHWLGVAEVVNAGVWIMIILFLWVDVFIQLRGIEHGHMYRINLACKALMYLTLIIVCIYWGFDGSFMDFWDAFLWIVAFFFIELNIFKWSEEIEHQHELEEAGEA